MTTPLGLNRELKTAAGAKFSDAAITTSTFSQGINVQGMDSIGLFVDLNTVGGTSPTCLIQLQTSFDNGANWIDHFPEDFNSESQAGLTAMTAAIETSKFWVIPFPVQPETDAGAVVKVRFHFELGGSSPSFTFGRVQVVTKAYR